MQPISKPSQDAQTSHAGQPALLSSLGFRNRARMELDKFIAMSDPWLDG
jgi:hypothetical protein